jgi:hypothetical protein
VLHRTDIEGRQSARRSETMSLIRSTQRLDARSRLARSEQVDIGTIDQLRRRHTEALHELMRFSNSNVGRFVLAEDDFELQEMPEILDDV